MRSPRTSGLTSEFSVSPASAAAQGASSAAAALCGKAIWSLARPVSLAAGTTLTFEMQCAASVDLGENLGHFRLSVSTDPAALGQHDQPVKPPRI